MNHLDPEIIHHFHEDEEYQKTHNDEMMHLNANMVIMHEKLDMLITRSKPALEWFDGLTFLKKFILTVLGIASAIGGAILLFKEVFKK